MVAAQTTMGGQYIRRDATVPSRKSAVCSGASRRVLLSLNPGSYDDVTPSDTYSVQAPSRGVTDWHQSQGYREPGRYLGRISRSGL
ncbi:hypothetical protein Tco_0614449 [Tanacetum coccineum]